MLNKVISIALIALTVSACGVSQNSKHYASFYQKQAKIDQISTQNAKNNKFLVRQVRTVYNTVGYNTPNQDQQIQDIINHCSMNECDPLVTGKY